MCKQSADYFVYKEKKGVAKKTLISMNMEKKKELVKKALITMYTGKRRKCVKKTIITTV